uniref:1-phosphatidylinositol-3-phosphate 5-kinase FAB1B-like n=1 Tax=Tanacetum cinerariifolium TaxID=118510 RepID=A0A6L2L2P1_TANCI|nr:1-phosphatidylinositol-3-phosphate 5-kinase FAB1B-like [Tanacetum cinerariifolium]
MDHLKMAVAKIDAHQPDVLLVEKSVSRYAQEYLLAKYISLVINIKRPLLERIVHCTSAQIAPLVDHLSFILRLGKWLHASAMHRSMYTLFTFLHPNLFTNMKIRNGYKMKSMRKTSGNSRENMPPSGLQLAYLEDMLQKEKAEFEESLQKVLNHEGKKDQPVIDILEINRLRRQLLFQSYVGGGSSPKKENEIDFSDPLRDNVGGGVHRALSKEQISVMASLLDTLDAAWTCNKMDTPSVMCDSDNGHHGEDQLLTTSSLPSPTFSTKGSENITEDSTSWFSMPFLNFYGAKNKNSITNSQNLDTLNNYKPVYISTYRESELEGGARLLLAVGVNDTVILVYDDEPTSIISYVLLTPDYMPQMSGD